MRVKKTAWTALVTIGVVLCGFGAAWAQEHTNEPPRIELGSQHDVNLSPTEMLTRARGFRPSMERDRQVVQQQAEAAKKQKDVVKALCLGDKLSQIDLAIRTTNDRVDALASAASQNDSDRCKHEYTIAEVLKERVAALVAEAGQCIGEETGFVGDSTVVVTIDPSVPDTDPSDFPEEPVVSEPPPTTSPTH
ncbi:MAG TPA: hypothetical protein VGI10_02600 [Polyangiaceae bacterium]|jgi:hypothetical protein